MYVINFQSIRPPAQSAPILPLQQLIVILTAGLPFWAEEEEERRLADARQALSFPRHLQGVCENLNLRPVRRQPLDDGLADCKFPDLGEI